MSVENGPVRFNPRPDTARRYSSGADLYPYLIVTAHLTDPERYRGRMLDMLRNEVRYTTIRRSLPGDFHSATRRVGKATLFGAAELIAGVELRAGDWIVEPAGEPPYGTAEQGGSP